MAYIMLKNCTWILTASGKSQGQRYRQIQTIVYQYCSVIKTKDDIFRKKTIRFKNDDDMRLLKEVVAQNPMKYKGKWTEVAENTSKPGFTVGARRARERTQLLINKHEKEEVENPKGSGTDQISGEKTALLDKIVEMREEVERGKREKTDSGKTENIVKGTQRPYLGTQIPQKDEEDKLTETAPQSNIFEYFKEKSNKELAIKRKEIKIRQEELYLERQKFELEKEEKQFKMRQEREGKLAFLELFKKSDK